MLRQTSHSGDGVRAREKRPFNVKAVHSGNSFGLWFIFGKLYRLSWYNRVQNFRYILTVETKNPVNSRKVRNFWYNFWNFRPFLELFEPFYKLEYVNSFENQQLFSTFLTYVENFGSFSFDFCEIFDRQK